MAKKVAIAKGLPTSIASSLGRMIARWSYLEIRMATIMYDLCGVNIKIGRIAINTPRVSDYPSRMKQLAIVRGIDLSPFEWVKFEKTLKDLKEERDEFAHSVWLKHQGVYMIQDTRGTWQPNKSVEKVSKRIMPEGKKITSHDLLLLRRKIEGAISEAETLARFVAISLRTYAKKHP